jgi:hypothetical protein
MIFLTLKQFFAQKPNDQDFSKYLDEVPQTRKQRLLEECKKNDVSPYINDPSESSSVIYAELRGVACEAELEQRLNTKRAVNRSFFANVIAIFALFISIAALFR